MAEVYWIRLPEHTDVFTQGYVGVTRNTAKSRFRGHVQSSKLTKGKNYRMTNVIKKYGRDNLVVETLVVCEEDYAYDLESKLRPTTHIGWNVAVGGMKSGNYGGYKLSEETRQKMSFARKGVKLTEEQKKNRPPNYAKGTTRGPLPKESVLKREETRFYTNMDKYPETWAYADIWYEHYLMGLNNYFTEKLLGIKKQLLARVFLHFESGWVPLNDPKWIAKFKQEEVIP